MTCNRPPQRVKGVGAVDKDFAALVLADEDMGDRGGGDCENTSRSEIP
jgi:hypothetical protein